MSSADPYFAPRGLTRKELLSLPRPSPEQVAEFVSHVSWAHSWYKHLPLLTGGEFAFFLAADAGDGYTSESPRLHYSWNTTQEYRERFGFLDYVYRVEPGEPFARDAGPPLDFPAGLVAATQVTLYPYSSSDFNAPAACLRDIHSEGIASLKAGRSHPAREGVLEWFTTQERLEADWGTLTADEQEAVLREEDAPGETGVPTPGVAAHRELSRAAEAAYQRLQRSEEVKIHESLERLWALLAHWQIEERLP